MLEIRSLSKRYGAVYALNKIDLSLDAGLTHVLLGSSGSGKSTLLRSILGLVQCDEGELLFEGSPVAGMTPKSRAQRMGYVPQEGGLFPHLTARENCTLIARSVGWSKARIEERLEELVPIVSLDRDLLNRYPREMSGGQRQRVAVLRAAFLNPDLLILDEPLGALDPLVRADLQQELKEAFARLRKTVVFVTHDLIEAAYLGNHLILMHEGRVIQKGTFGDLRDRPATPFVRRFLNAQRVPEGGAS